MQLIVFLFRNLIYQKVNGWDKMFQLLNVKVQRKLRKSVNESYSEYIYLYAGPGPEDPYLFFK